jgi:hypothetical protein
MKNSHLLYVDEFPVHSVSNTHTMKKPQLKHARIESDHSTPSHHVGKWRVSYVDGREIIPLPLTPDEEWPSYPTILDTEEDAEMYKKCWADYIYALGRSKA